MEMKILQQLPVSAYSHQLMLVMLVPSVARTLLLEMEVRGDILDREGEFSGDIGHAQGDKDHSDKVADTRHELFTSDIQTLDTCQTSVVSSSVSETYTCKSDTQDINWDINDTDIPARIEHYVSILYCSAGNLQDISYHYNY